MKNSLQENQTEFIDDVVVRGQEPTVQPVAPAATQSKIHKQKQIAALVAVVTIIFVSIAVCMVLLRNTTVPEAETELLGTTPTPETAQSEIAIAVNKLKKNLQAADPVAAELPLPPVNLDLYLDQPIPVK